MKLEVKRPEKVVEFCLDGELHAAYEAKKQEMDESRRKALADKRMADPTVALARELLELGDKIRGESVKFLIRGLPRKQWSTLTAENPAREGHQVDKSYGFNLDAVMLEAIPESIVSVSKDGEPVDFDPAADWEATADEMTDIQYEDFVLAVLTVNRGRQEVPFSLDAYRQTVGSEKM